MSSELVRALLADRLSADEELRIEVHLADCLRCRRLAEQAADDTQARRFQAEHQRSRSERTESSDEVDLLSLRQQVHLLGWYTSDAPPGSTRELADDATPFAAGASAEPYVASRSVGRFETIRLIGSGGFGVVYLARDRILHRQVALKLARTSVLADPDLKCRFMREAEALARLQHAHIVPVFEAGEFEGTCYLAVGYCAGPTLAQWLVEQSAPAPPRLAARLILQLAEAVQHAHECGVLHRDVKPSNVLLDSLPADKCASPRDLPFVPKLTDFGLAKIIEQDSQATHSGTLLGTPPYMAPEQAAGMAERVGPATDVYALGAVLYEMLTGRTPIGGSSPADTLRRVLIDEPVPPTQLVRDVPDDLAAIALKCLDKSPTRRYASAADLAEDLQRFLAGFSTLARPLSVSQRAMRWVRRNRTASIVMGLLVLIVALTGGVLAVNRQFARFRSEVALREFENQYREDIVAAAGHIADGDVRDAENLLRRYSPKAGQPDLRGFEWHYLWAQTTHEVVAEHNASSDVYQVALSPDKTLLAAACADGTIQLLDSATLAKVTSLASSESVVADRKRDINSVAWSTDGRSLAAACDDGCLRIWDVAQRRERLRIHAHLNELAFGVVFYDGDQKLASCGQEPTVRLWDATTGEVVGTLEGHSRSVEAMALSPIEPELATAGSDNVAIVWDLTARREIRRFDRHSGRLTSVAYSPDGRLLVTGSVDRSVRVWNLGNQELVGEEDCLDGIQSVAFSSDGQRLIVADRAGVIRNYRVIQRGPPKWEVELELQSTDDVWHGHDGRVWSLLALPSDQRFVSAGSNSVRSWRRGQTIARHWSVAPDAIGGCVFHREAPLLLTTQVYAGIVAYDANTLQPQFSLDEPNQIWNQLTVLPSRDEVAAGSDSGDVFIWNWKSRSLVHRWTIEKDCPIHALKYSPAAKLIAAMTLHHNGVFLISAESGELVRWLPLPDCSQLAFSPDNRHMVVDVLNNVVTYDLQTFHQVFTAEGHTNSVTCVAYSPDGELIASGGNDRTVRLWSARDGRPIVTLRGHRAGVNAVSFSPDGRSLISGDQEGQLKVYQVATGRELLDFSSGLPGVTCVDYSPDGHRIVVTNSHHDLLVIGSGGQH